MPPSFSVTGGRALKGTIRPAGNKNAALPILAATLLADGPCRIDNVPHIRDVETMLALLVHLGADVRWLGPNSVEVNTARAEPRELDPALCARIRASILLAGPMLARFGRVSLPPPGGDVIGRRRVDTHFLALERLGAEVTIGAACEPHVQDLARFLSDLGAKVQGVGRTRSPSKADRPSRPPPARWDRTTSRSARSSGSPPSPTARSRSTACAARISAVSCWGSSGWACDRVSTAPS